MCLMRFTLLFLLLISPICFAQQQYTEAACLLLQQQADRFAGQPNSRTYLDTRRVLHIAQAADYINQYYQICFSDEQLRQFSARLNIASTNSKALSKLHLEQVKAKKAA